MGSRRADHIPSLLSSAIRCITYASCLARSTISSWEPMDESYTAEIECCRVARRPAGSTRAAGEEGTAAARACRAFDEGDPPEAGWWGAGGCRRGDPGVRGTCG